MGSSISRMLIEDQQAQTLHDTNGKGEPIQIESDQAKWIRGDRQARNWLADDVRSLFIHDRGADSFAFYTEVVEDMENAGFIVRANQNRRIWTDSGEPGKLFDWSSDLAEQGRKTIEMQQGGGREARTAEVSIATGTCELRAPRNNPDQEGSVEVNVVRVDEISEDDDPIQWVLLTTESVEEFDETLTVIDYYGLRWRIEDWHKVLKTGCEIEERQLQTWEPDGSLAECVLSDCLEGTELRELARGESAPSAEVLLSEAERTILEKKFPELSEQDGKAYAVSVAKLGGYLDRGADPPPGWQTMWKGLQKLRMWAEGYELGAE